MQGAGFSGTGAKRRDGFACVRETPLGFPKTRFRLTLLLLETTDRGFGFHPTRIKARAFLLSASPLEGNRLAFPFEAFDVLTAPGDLRRVTDDVLLEPVLFGGECGDCRGRLRDGEFNPFGLSGESRERLPV